MCDDKNASLLIKVLRDDVAGQLLAEHVSELDKKIIESSIRTHKRLPINFLPSVSPIDLVLLCLVGLNNGVKLSKFKELVISEFPEYKYVLNYSLLRAVELGLLMIDEKDVLSVSDVGKKLLKDSIDSLNIMKEKIERDSLLNVLSSV